MRNILTTIAVIVGIGVAIWLSAMLFIGLAAIAVVGYGLYFARGFLIDKGILNPTPGIAPDSADQPERITIIEGDFTRVDEPAIKKED